MREGWRESTLGEASDLVMGQSPPGSSYNTAGEGLPFIQGSAEFGAHHPTPAKWCNDPRKVAEPGDVLLSVRAPVGDTNVANERIAIGRGLALVRGRKGDTSTPFLRLTLEHSVDKLLARSGGGMFSSITGAALKTLPINLPPLSEQRRIVDLIGAVDEAIARAERARRDAAQALARLRRLDASDEYVSLGDLATMRSGPSWKAADESPVSLPGFDPVLGITNTPVSGAIDLTDRRFVRGVPRTAQRLTQKSLVMIRTNGNRTRIGNIYRSTPETLGFAVSAFQIAVEPQDARDASYLFWYLGSEPVQKAITDAASGSTGLGNIAVGWLKQLAIPKLEPSRQSEYVALCEASGAAVHRLTSTLTNLRTLRSNLLTALLSGEHEMPESYDELIGVES